MKVEFLETQFKQLDKLEAETIFSGRWIQTLTIQMKKKWRYCWCLALDRYRTIKLRCCKLKKIIRKIIIELQVRQIMTNFYT